MKPEVTRRLELPRRIRASKFICHSWVNAGKDAHSDEEDKHGVDEADGSAEPPVADPTRQKCLDVDDAKIQPLIRWIRMPIHFALSRLGVNMAPSINGKSMRVRPRLRDPLKSEVKIIVPANSHNSAWPRFMQLYFPSATPRAREQH